MKTLLILNDPPYGTQWVYNALRLAQALLKKEPQTEITVFLMADAVVAAKAGQKTPDGYYNIGCAVGAPFAVLVAEELFASGCRLLINLTSAGQIVPVAAPPYFVIIDRAVRDEGTSYHYAAPQTFAEADARLVATARRALEQRGLQVFVGASWTTDAPFRETAAAVSAAQAKGVLAVEMEAAALYALAQNKRVPVLCLAHVTNTMGLADRDFEKGEAAGTADALKILDVIAMALRAWEAAV